MEQNDDADKEGRGRDGIGVGVGVGRAARAPLDNSGSGVVVTGAVADDGRSPRVARGARGICGIALARVEVAVVADAANVKATRNGVVRITIVSHIKIIGLLYPSH